MEFTAVPSRVLQPDLTYFVGLPLTPCVPAPAPGSGERCGDVVLSSQGVHVVG